MVEKINAPQPELELIFSSKLDEPTTIGPAKRVTSFEPSLETSLNSIWGELTEGREVPLEPRTSDDPFYIAQLLARDLATLQSLDQMPVINLGLPFDEDEAKSSELMGLQAQNELNRITPVGVRNNRLAVSTFMLTALIPPEQRPLAYYDKDEEVLVSGLFKEFLFTNYEQRKTIVVPLHQPKILEPRSLRDIEITSVKLPVLSMDDWEFDQTA